MAASEDNERFLNPDTDPFKPPAANTEVGCLHCQETYDSYQIEWRVFTDPDGSKHGFWCCPTPGCDGKGFGFDILPTDPNYRDEHGGWVHDDDDDEDELGDDDEDYFEDDLDEADLELTEPAEGEAGLENNGHPKKKDGDGPEPPSTNGHSVPW